MATFIIEKLAQFVKLCNLTYLDYSETWATPCICGNLGS
jgi:hypothetical protein